MNMTMLIKCLEKIFLLFDMSCYVRDAMPLFGWLKGMLKNTVAIHELQNVYYSETSAFCK